MMMVGEINPAFARHAAAAAGPSLCRWQHPFLRRLTRLLLAIQQRNWGRNWMRREGGECSALRGWRSNGEGRGVGRRRTRTRTVSLSDSGKEGNGREGGRAPPQYIFPFLCPRSASTGRSPSPPPSPVRPSCARIRHAVMSGAEWGRRAGAASIHSAHCI